MAKVILDHVSKVYENRVEAVADLSLEIEDKEFVVLVGPSGCGKSTILRMIAGLEEVTSGDIYIDGKRVNEDEPGERDIAMVFQNYALYPHMTVFDNMAFGLKLRRKPREEIMEKVMNAARILGIEDLLRRKPGQLSGGERQRVALGRAMVRDPKVFLMDEPLSNLDSQLRIQMRSEMAKLHRRIDTTFIYVTHDQTEAMTMGTRIAVIKGGRLSQFDSPQKIYDAPRDLFVAGFIGTPQMNLITASVLEIDGRVALKAGGDLLRLPDNAFLKQYVGKTVILGLRPEDAYYGEEESMAVCAGEVDLVERLGSESHLYVNTPGGRIGIKAKPQVDFVGGEKVIISLDLDKAHLFDADTGQSIPGGISLEQ